MPTIGFLFNFPEGSVSKHPFFLYRVAPMVEYLEQHGIRVFVYSPRHVGRDDGRVVGFIRKQGRFEPLKRSVPKVNGNWYIGSDRSIIPGGMGGRKFRGWALKHGIDLYPNANFTDQLRDKMLTYELVARIDPDLHPHTELYADEAQQLARFLDQGEKVFLKPRVGNKGNQIVVLTENPDGVGISYYNKMQQITDIAADRAQALEKIRPLTADLGYVIQSGIALPTHEEAKFILRVIMLSDGNNWDWVHKAVLAARGSEIANTTQGGTNHPTEAFLAQIYGEQHLAALMDEVRRVCFGTVERLDADFDYGLMEVGYDLVIDEQRRVYIVEINTRPGMTKPGLPKGDVFTDIFNRTPDEEVLYRKYVQPHGTLLAKFLRTRLEQHQQRKKRRSLHRKNAVARTQPLSDTNDNVRLDEAIRHAAGYLAAACRDDGMFNYRVNLDPKVTIKPRYNLQRHAGTMHGLCSYLDLNTDPTAAEALTRAAVFLRAQCHTATADGTPRFAVWSLPELETDAGHTLARPAGTGLALAAFLLAATHAPACIELTQLQALGDFLLDAQLPDGSFPSKYLPDRGGYSKPPGNLRGTGTAALGLALLFERDPDPRWRDASLNALAVLARRDDPALPADPWALLATAKIVDWGQYPAGTVEKDELVGHAVRVCDSILEEQVLHKDSAGHFGGFSRDGLTAPTSIRVNCLLAALGFLAPEEPARRERIWRAIEHGIDFLLRCQVRDGAYAGGMPRAIGPVAGNFNRRAGEIRIDYVQHALCAFLAYQRQRETALSPTDNAPAGAGETPARSLSL